MPRGNWGNLFAAIRLAILIGIGASWLWLIWQVSADYTARAQRAESNARQYAESADSRVARACAGTQGAALLECVAEEIRTSREDQRTEYDLQAQQDSADAAFWMAVISAATLLATVVALWFVKGTLEATREAVREAAEGTKAAVIAAEAGREANEITSKNANRQLRAYVSVRETYLENRYEADPHFITTIKNFGQTTAQNVWVHCNLDFLSELPTQIMRPMMINELGSIEPGAEQYLFSGFSPDMFEAHESELTTGARRIYLWGNIDYTDVFGAAYTKRFIIYVSHRRIHNLPPIRAVFFVSDEDAGGFEIEPLDPATA